MGFYAAVLTENHAGEVELMIGNPAWNSRGQDRLDLLQGNNYFVGIAFDRDIPYERSSRSSAEI